MCSPGRVPRTPTPGPGALTYYVSRNILGVLIKSFADKATAATFQGLFARRLPAAVRERARDKLAMIDAATGLNDLKVPPANRLEPLSGDRVGQWSIRINRQWRICFRWENGHAWDVEITDYHRG